MARGGARIVPYEVTKILLVLFGMTAPLLPWVGGLAILLFTAGAELGFFFLPPESRALSLREPWQMAIACVIGLGLFARRLHHHRTRRQLAFEHAKNTIQQKITQELGKIRDPVEEALRTLGSSAALLEEKFPDLRDLSDALKSALNRLSELRKVLFEKR
jgi:hypothetical protein